MFNVTFAKANFCQLLCRAEDGEEIIVARNGKPVAKLVPLGPEDLLPSKQLGARAKQRFWTSSDFRALPPDMASRLENG